jgi:phage terminase large subunit-like protein
MESYYDEKKGEHAVQWIEKYCTHVKGALGGSPFILEDWQKEDIIRPLFGTIRADGLRRYRQAYIEVPRKNGKSNLCAAIALYMLFADKEPGAEIISAAGDRNQARIVFEIASAMCANNKQLQAHGKVLRNTIEYKNSFYKAISAEANTKHGFNAHAVILDELHVFPNRSLYDVLKTSTGARTQPLVIAITTAGHDTSSICYELHEYAQQVKDGSIHDDTFLPVIYAADKADDWTQPATWAKANPGYGTICKADYFEQEVNRCKANPRQINTFLRLHLNIWTASEERWVTDEEFMRGADFVDDSYLQTLPCYGGMDLSSTKDLTAVALIFRDDRNDCFYLKCHHFVNEDKANSKKLAGSVDYHTFQRLGLVSITEGNVTDMEAVQAHIRNVAAKYDLRALAYDRYIAHLVVPFLDGIDCQPFGQGYASMSYPTKQFEMLMCDGQIKHGGHDVLRWQMGCVSLSRDEADNIKVTKKKNSESQKVDGVVASIMAMGCYFNNASEDEPLLEVIHL